MLTTRLFKISKQFKHDICFLPKTQSLLTCKNVTILNRAFLCSAEGVPNTDAADQKQNRVTVTRYHQYFMNDLEYMNLMFRKDIKANTKSAEILNQLDKEGQNNLSLNNELAKHLDRELIQFSFLELCEVIYLALKCVNKNDDYPFWENILQNINKECFYRTSFWTVDELIKVANLLIMFPKSLQVKMKVLYKLLKKSFTRHQIVCLTYFLWRLRLKVPKDYVFQLEMRTVKIIPETDLTELEIILQCFLCCFSSVQYHNVIEAILLKAIEVQENMDKQLFNSVSKFMVKNLNVYNHRGIFEFQEKTLNTVLKLGTEEVVRLAQTGSKINYLDPNLRTVFMEEVKKHIRKLPLLHIERAAYLTTKFNIHDEEFLKLAVDEFSNRDLTKNDRSSLIQFLSHLIHYKIYPENLLRQVIEKKFADSLLEAKLSRINAWWFLYCSLGVERPEYINFDLDAKTRKKMYYISSNTFYLNAPRYYSSLWKVKTTLMQLFGEETVKKSSPLPHYPHGLLMKFDKNSTPQILPEKSEYFKAGYIIKPIQDDHKWIFFTICNISDMADFENTDPSFIFQTKLRQFNAIGCTPLLVMNKLLMSHKNKGDYLKHLIDAKLEECWKNQRGAVIN